MSNFRATRYPSIPTLRSVVRRILVFAFSTLIYTGATAQAPLQSPADFLGYELGSRFTPHHRVVEYVRHVADSSDRVEVEIYGESYEHRPLIVVYVSTPANMARLDEIRRRHLDVVHGRRSYSDADPAIVFMSYNVHGNESSSSEAALRTLYVLASGEDARVNAWLEDAVVIIDPMLNPDGRDRYVNWYNQVVGVQPDPGRLSRERSEPWPGSRTNHYYFDLNRDWAWMTQKETRFRIPLYNNWMPHIHVDFHEQNPESPYYFAPAAEPFHVAITDWQREFQTTIGLNNARYFDANSWLYFTRQLFDLFYPGYGDTWPTFNGSIGMTYEQAGGGAAGRAYRTLEGDTLTLADRIEHHHTTGMATIEVAVRHRQQLLQEFEAYFDQARSGRDGVGSYIVRRGDNPAAVDALAEHLGMQGIEVGTVGATRNVPAMPFDGGNRSSLEITPGDLVVSTHQPKGILVDVLFEANPVLGDSITYDMTSWSLPYVYNIDAFTTTDQIATQPYTAPLQQTDRGVDRPYAYLVRWDGQRSVRFLADVLRNDIRLRFNVDPFETAGERWAAGTLIITRTGNTAIGDQFDDIVRAAAERANITAHGVASGFVSSGADFGSRDINLLPALRVAALSGDPVSAYSLGEVWHYFDEQIEYPLTLIDHARFDAGQLDDIDVLILPDGNYGRVFDEGALASLKAWVAGGGRLIAMKRAVTFFAGKDGFGLESRARPDSAESPDSLQQRLRTFGDREREAMSARTSGSIYRVELDSTHPLAFGYDDGYYTMKDGVAAFEFLEGGWNAGIISAEAPVAGFAGSEARERLHNTLVFGQQPMGRGEIVYLVDSPLFRGFWYGGRLLFANAVFMAGAGSR